VTDEKNSYWNMVLGSSGAQRRTPNAARRGSVWLFCASLLAANPVWAESTAAAENQADAAVATEPTTETESQQFARARLMEMAGLLGKTERLSVSLNIAYDVVQENGQKIEFGEIRELALQRPDRLRIMEIASHGDQDLTLFDGERITILDGDTNVYAQAPQPGDIDASIIHFVRDLQMRLPLAPLMLTKASEELQRRIQSIDYVEHTDILGAPAHHIAARTASVDFQVWIADSEQALPMRIVVTYPSDEGQPQFRADFSDWNLIPRFDKGTFEFTPPAAAKRIVFAAQLPPAPASPLPQDSRPEGAKP